MGILEEETGIKKLDSWDLPNTVKTDDGWESKTIPEATAKNMQIYMDKINELTDAVNSLTRMNKGLIEALK